jgi:hypothetical protein
LEYLGQRKKSQFWHDILEQEQIDIVFLQDTKKPHFTQRKLNKISSRINKWQWLAADGSAGGISIGYNDELVLELFCWIGQFSCTLLFNNN